MRYILGTGFFDGKGSGSSWFFENLWKPNVRRLFQKEMVPANIIIISVCNSRVLPDEQMIEVPLSGDLGHVHQLIGRKMPFKENEISSWEATVLSLALIAYCNESDLVFLEQDALAFGNWVSQMYNELDGKKMLFGKSRCMPCAQSIFFIRHNFLLDFVRAYLSVDRSIKLGEEKFLAIERLHPLDVGRFSFGFDRDRPLDFALPVWYGQKFTADELEQMKARNFISYDHLPEGIGRFTND